MWGWGRDLGTKRRSFETNEMTLRVLEPLLLISIVVIARNLPHAALTSAVLFGIEVIAAFDGQVTKRIDELPAGM